MLKTEDLPLLGTIQTKYEADAPENGLSPSKTKLDYNSNAISTCDTKEIETLSKVGRYGVCKNSNDNKNLNQQGEVRNNDRFRSRRKIQSPPKKDAHSPSKRSVASPVKRETHQPGQLRYFQKQLSQAGLINQGASRRGTKNSTSRRDSVDSQKSVDSKVTVPPKKSYTSNAKTSAKEAIVTKNGPGDDASKAKPENDVSSKRLTNSTSKQVFIIIHCTYVI